MPAGRPPINEEPLDARITVRLRQEEKTRLEADAALAGIPMGELVRRRYFGKRIVAKTDEIMLRELRRLGGLLKHIHTETRGAYSQDTAAVLHAIKTAIERLS